MLQDIEDARGTLKKQKANAEVVKKAIKAVRGEIKKKEQEIACLNQELLEYQAASERVEERQAELQEESKELECHLSTANEELVAVSAEVCTIHTCTGPDLGRCVMPAHMLAVPTPHGFCQHTGE